MAFGKSRILSNFNFSIRVYVSVLFFAVAIVVSTTQIWLTQNSLNKMLLQSNQALFERIASETHTIFSAKYHSVFSAVRGLSSSDLMTANNIEERKKFVPVIFELLADSTADSVYQVGYPNGDLFVVTMFGPDIKNSDFDAPANTMFMVENHSFTTKENTHLFYDGNKQWLATTSSVDNRTDSRTFSWFQNTKINGVNISVPNYSQKIGQFGLDVSQRHASGAVVSANLLSKELSRTLQQTLKKPSSIRVLYDSSEYVYAYSDPSVFDKQANFSNQSEPMVKNINEAVMLSAIEYHANESKSEKNTLHSEWINGELWYTQVVNIPIYKKEDLYLLIIARASDLFDSGEEILFNALLSSFLLLLILLPMIYYVSRWVSKPIKQASLKAKSIENLDFTAPPLSPSSIKEINELRGSLSGMQNTLSRFISMTNAIAQEHNLEQLLGRVCKDTARATGSKGTFVYLLDSEKNKLVPHYVWAEGTGERNVEQYQTLDVDDERLKQLMDKLIRQQTYVAISAEKLRELSAKPIAQPSDWYLFFPLLDRKRNVIGTIGFSSSEEDKRRILVHQLHFIEALTGYISVTIEARKMSSEQKALLDSIIQLMASTIDTKSPYTGNHCQRVPVLTQWLAKAAHDNDDTYRSFHLNEEEWEELRIAAWLHDCGKITTPEYVVDKSVKLETIYNRIHEIRTRFEVLKRDAEIKMYKIALKNELPTELRQQLELQWQQLDDEFAFIAQVNQGGEFLSHESIERIGQIGNRSWGRTLSNRLGLSWVEAERYSDKPEQLPVQEKLLQDKPEHLIDWKVITETDPRFSMVKPQYQANLGERYNLSIQRGTLTEEERFIINDHIIQTIKMLERLPFPSSMKNIPSIAGGHHEKMDGTGYPMGLKAEEMPLTARIMAIADIFEALTSSDRPYKKAKTLSESINIMSFMAKDQHIDAQLFKLFLTSGIYQQYAEQFMAAEQIDSVDISKYVAA